MSWSGLQWQNICTGYCVNPWVGSEVWRWKCTQACTHAHGHEQKRGRDFLSSWKESKLSAWERIKVYLSYGWGTRCSHRSVFVIVRMVAYKMWAVMRKELKCSIYKTIKHAGPYLVPSTCRCCSSWCVSNFFPLEIGNVKHIGVNHNGACGRICH